MSPKNPFLPEGHVKKEEKKGDESSCGECPVGKLCSTFESLCGRIVLCRLSEFQVFVTKFEVCKSQTWTSAS